MKRDTISRFNRDTVWLATGLLGTVAFAALVLASQEYEAKARQAESEPFLNGDPALVKSLNSGEKMTSGSGSGDDHSFTETPLLQATSSAPTPARVLASTPEISHNTHRRDSTPERRSRTRNVQNRLAEGFGTVDVKRRLIALWHRSLARNDKPRSWTAFSNLSRGASKKAAYTAETTH